VAVADEEVAAVASELKDDVAETAAAEAPYVASAASTTSGALSDLLEALRAAARSVSWSRRRLSTELSLVLQMDLAQVMLRLMMMLLFFLLVLLLLLSASMFFPSAAAAAAAGCALFLPEEDEW